MTVIPERSTRYVQIDTAAVVACAVRGVLGSERKVQTPIRPVMGQGDDPVAPRGERGIEGEEVQLVTRKSSSAGKSATGRRSQVPSLGALRPSDLVATVLASLIRRNALEPSSVPVYEDLLRRFAAFCEEGLGIEDSVTVEHDDVRRFIESRRSDGHLPAVRTQRLRMGAVRLLYREGRSLGLVGHDPTIDIMLSSLSH